MITGQINSDIIDTFSYSFELLCISILIEGYQDAQKDPKHSIDWKENSFTNHLVNFMRKSQKTTEKHLFIKVQTQPENNNTPDEDINDPDKQPCIDIWIGSWNASNEKNEYFIEAKNICDNDWVKTNGANVSASKQKGRYISTGIDNFKTGRYKKGCLVGYVINCLTIDCVNGINKLLIKNNRESECLEKHTFFNDFDKLYQSKHNNIILIHVFLEFN